MEEMYICPGCKELRLSSDYRAKGKRGKTSRRKLCKYCREMGITTYSVMRKKRAAREEAVCRVCKKTLKLKEFEGNKFNCDPYK